MEHTAISSKALAVLKERLKRALIRVLKRRKNPISLNEWSRLVRRHVKKPRLNISQTEYDRLIGDAQLSLLAEESVSLTKKMEVRFPR